MAYVHLKKTAPEGVQASATGVLENRTEERFQADGTICLILDHEGDYPRLIGGIGMGAVEGGHEFGYWLTPSAWGRGYATEAGRAMVAAARHTLGLRRLKAGHFVDNPASGRVLTKLGFRPTGTITPRASLARGGETPCVDLVLDLAEEDCRMDRLAA